MPPTLRCQSCQAVHPVQPVVEVCPDCGGELERVEGCKRVGVKRVDGTGIAFEPEPKQMNRSIYGETNTLGRICSYADPDGRETVADFHCAEGCPVARLDEQAGERKSGGGIKNPIVNQPYNSNRTWSASKTRGNKSGRYEPDSGGVSRFYINADWQHEVAEQLAQADPVRYQPKAPKKERNSGLDDFYWRRDKASPTGFVRVSQEEWEGLGKKERARGNIHPTVKPLSLLIWLAKLLLPPPEYAPRRILVPFSGSGSETIGAFQAGWEEIVAIELYRDYCDIAESRAAFWLTRQLELFAARPPRCG